MFEALSTAAQSCVVLPAFLIFHEQGVGWVAGADLDTSMTMARGALPGDLQWSIDDMLTNRGEWWVPGKIVEIREQLSPVWRNCEDPSSLRSLLLLDISLEAFLRTRIEASTGGIDSMTGAREKTVLLPALSVHAPTSCHPPDRGSHNSLHVLADHIQSAQGCSLQCCTLSES